MRALIFAELNLDFAPLIDARKKHHIGLPKNRQQLIEALQKSAEGEIAEKAKPEAVDAEK